MKPAILLSLAAFVASPAFAKTTHCEAGNGLTVDLEWRALDTGAVNPHEIFFKKSAQLALVSVKSENTEFERVPAVFYVTQMSTRCGEETNGKAVIADFTEISFRLPGESCSGGSPGKSYYSITTKKGLSSEEKFPLKCAQVEEQ